MKLVTDNAQAVSGIQTVQNEVQRLRTLAMERMTGKDFTTQAFEQQTRALEDLKAKYVPLFAVERQHEANLHEIRNARAMGVLTMEEATNAIQRETMAYQAATAAMAGHTNATLQNNRANAQRTNLMFQLQDIGVSLASGMNPLMVAAQQGSQVAMIYGPEEGGLGRALSETGKMAAGLVSKIGPLALVLGGASLAIAGMRHEIEQTSGVAVSFGDVLAAVFQVPAKAIYDHFKPALDDMAAWWGREWELFVQQTKEGGNFMVRETLGAIDIIGTSVMSIPDAFIAAGEAAAEGFANVIIYGFREVQVGMNDLITDINGMAGKIGLADLIPTMDLVDYADFDFGGEAALERLNAGWGALNDRLKGIAETDYMGEFFGAVQSQAIDNYNAGLGETATAAVKAASGVDVAKEAISAFNQEMDFYKSTFSGFFTDIFKGLREGGNAWDVFADAATSALDRIADRAVAASSDKRFDWYGLELAA